MKRRVPSPKRVGALITVALALLLAILPLGSERAEAEHWSQSPYLALSQSSDRSGAVPLEGATVEAGDEVAIFVAPTRAWFSKARFSVNGQNVRTEYYRPYDLGGTDRNGNAVLVPTDSFTEGVNTVEVKLFVGRWRVATLSASFTKVTPLPTIAELATGDPRFSTLVTALTLASEEGPTDFLGAVSNPDADLTVFAPTDDAFAALGATLDAALADPGGLLTQVLAYHVLGSSESGADLVAATEFVTLQGEKVTITARDGAVFINDSKVVIADIQARNGIVHVIDAVLIPPSIANPPLPTIAEIATGDPRFSTLVSALALASEEGPTDFLGAVSDPEADLTVFAPTNDAFAALGDTLDTVLADPDGLLTQVLAYHVIGSSLSGAELVQAVEVETLGGEIMISLRDGEVFINDSKVVIADIEASNGIVHVIDAVLIPPSIVNPLPTIADIATSDPRFSTLVIALTQASQAGPTNFLAAVSNPEADLTVFAPTNDAFAALGDTLNAALADPGGLLTQVLAYHVLGSSESGADLLAAGEFTTLQGEKVMISLRDGAVFINNSQVVIQDIQARNGIVHVIDAVLIPPSIANPPASIGDSVVGSDGVGVANVSIDLFTATADGGRDVFVKSTRTNGSGVYNFSANAGCYVVVFIAPPGQAFATGQYQETSVCVEASEVVDAVDAVLSPIPH